MPLHFPHVFLTSKGGLYQRYRAEFRSFSRRFSIISRPECSGTNTNYIFVDSNHFGVYQAVFFDKFDALRDLLPFAQFKKREKHPWRSVTLLLVCNFTKSNTLPWVFFTFFKLYK